MTDSDPSAAYELGERHGYEKCQNEMKEIIESMAYEITKYRYPGRYSYSEDVEKIMSEFGF